jgi:hypothetical protein
MTAIITVDPLRDSAGMSGVSADDSAVSAAPQRHVATLRGTRRPHDGQTRLNPVWSWPALSEVEASGIGHNRELNNR